MQRIALRIRPLGAEDAGELHAIDRICFPEDIAFSREEMEHYLKHPKSFARSAEIGGKMAGFILARIDRYSGAHILTLDVIPGIRQRGVGTALMNELHDELESRRVRVCFLEVGVRNAPARSLYERLQYRYLGVLPGYYRGREDAYRMARFFGEISA